MFCVTFNRQSGHFVGRGFHGSAAIVAAGNAGEGGDVRPKKSYFLHVVGHSATAAGTHIEYFIDEASDIAESLPSGAFMTFP